MAFIDVLRDTNADYLIWKWRDDSKGKREFELRSGTKIIVNESQEAALFIGGKLVDVMGPGIHTLHELNIPMLVQFKKLVYGGNSPLSAEVYFVNKTNKLDIKWGIQPFNINENYVPIPVTAKGSFGVSIANSREFLVKLSGVVREFNPEELTKYFQGIINEFVKDSIGSLIAENKLSVFDLEINVRKISQEVSRFITEKIAVYGINITLFAIEAISINSEDPDVKELITKIRQTMGDDISERKRFKRRGENLDVYKTERLFDTTEKAAESSGSGGGSGSNILGTMVGLNMGAVLGGSMGKVMGDALDSVDLKGNKEKEICCPKCNKSNLYSAKFCSGCGATLTMESNMILCPECKTENKSENKFCSNCGKTLKLVCPDCNTVNPDNSKFCSECGKKLL
jgi:membrane protease subunit (stomatin/prohibitin family)